MSKLDLNREAWLQRAIELVRPWFTDLGHTMPPLQVSVGFTSKGARSHRIGECWSPTAANGHVTIFVHPALKDPIDVLGVLIHELVHAAVGVEHKHGYPFRRVALAVGLCGKMTATSITAELDQRLRSEVLPQLGHYPHESLNSRTTSTGPKQKARMLKVSCLTDGYTVRLTRMWLDRGAPICPMCNEQMVEL